MLSIFSEISLNFYKYEGPVSGSVITELQIRPINFRSTDLIPDLQHWFIKRFFYKKRCVIASVTKTLDPDSI
jgi:hypothetical protein